ncbi:MAG: hypothetical protein Q9204_007566 [Flavoplaca sp. TL-2023a]
MQIGFCPDPVFCGGIGNIKCEGEVDGTQKCVDDPRDSCDPKKGGRDCGGICVVNTKPPVEKKRICATLSGFQCLEGENKLANYTTLRTKSTPEHLPESIAATVLFQPVYDKNQQVE